MQYHFATTSDLDLLAQWNHMLICDEGHRNSMSMSELRERMADWIGSGYKAVIFSIADHPVAYALYRESRTDIHLRQFFVRRDRRREGIGRAAVEILKNELWSGDKRLTVDVLTDNVVAVAFWRCMGYQDYALTLEILPVEKKTLNSSGNDHERAK